MEETTNKGGAPEGNDNAKRGSYIRGAIRRALAKDEAEGRSRLNETVDRMLTDAAMGDAIARRELFDRLDGKPAQTISGDPDNPLNIAWPLPKSPLDR